jgi:hypothetical protein
MVTLRFGAMAVKNVASRGFDGGWVAGGVVPKNFLT